MAAKRNQTKATASKRGSKRTGTKVDVCQEVTDRIIGALERGVTPWVRPWSAHPLCNGHSGYTYQGVNILLLHLSGYSDHRWYTYKQIADGYGGSHVRRGERGSKVVYWAFRKVEEKTTDPKTGDETVSVKKIPFPIMHTVFNHEQIEWAEGQENQKHTSTDNVLVASAVEADFAEIRALVEASGAALKHGGTRASYNWVSDVIRLPRVGAFKSASDYWATVLHELVHWTGHESRLNRDFGGRFGDEAYAFEELVAEMGAAFLCASLGIDGKLQHESYIASWIKVLKNDKYALFTAAKKAQEVMAFLMGEGSVTDEDESNDAAGAHAA